MSESDEWDIEIILMKKYKIKNYEGGNTMLKTWQDFWKEEDGMGTVEIILIIVVLISLVMIFKTQLTNLVGSIFEKIVRQANTI